MKKIFFLLFAIADMTACQPENSSQKEKVTLADTLVLTPAAASPDTGITQTSNQTNWHSIEVFNLELALINGILPPYTTKEKLIQVLGTPTVLTRTPPSAVLILKKRRRMTIIKIHPALKCYRIQPCWANFGLLTVISSCTKTES
jgi:hypothetical protein